jgi:hypothetical protein
MAMSRIAKNQMIIISYLLQATTIKICSSEISTA